MERINLILGIHCHQPVGNFESVFENNYKQSYLPFLLMLLEFPDIKFTLHYSGVLLKWLERVHPEYFEIIKTLISRNQVELLGGAFYEPIISVIPDNDKIDQIKYQSNYIKKKFSYDVNGLWLAERVWEPHLPKILNESGIKYTILDDSHFKNAGLSQEKILGYFKTEEQGRYINIFPISEKLRYSIPFRLPEETINYLRNFASSSNKRLLVMIDDGEKFGSWPHTYKWVYEQKWLENFFNALIKNKDWINLTTFSEYTKESNPEGLIYFPDGSYMEMLEWTLPVNQQETLERLKSEMKKTNQSEQYNLMLRGGFWRNYFFKYPESNLIHKKMLSVSKKISESEVPADIKEEAKHELWQGQCNCAYWHGVFGGLYLPHLRNALFSHLIKAEQIIDQNKYKDQNNWVEIKEEDLNGDGLNEVIINTNICNYYFAPHKGGTIFELDFKPRSFNLIDTLSRKKEFYHNKIICNEIEQKKDSNSTKSIHEIVNIKEAGLDKFLNYDWYEHKYLIDHFFEENISFESFYQANYHELGDFVNQLYEHEIVDNKDFLKVILQRHGKVLNNNKYENVSISKIVTIKKNELDISIDYTIENLSNVDINLCFGIEFAFTFLA
ncbi:DUF1926 domain-containing protein, partial [Candidatus Poribacteria bacterium]|nr:DUF1926 domain-containing protein [Candidatus Poribacteria bacterium]